MVETVHYHVNDPKSNLEIRALNYKLVEFYEIYMQY